MRVNKLDSISFSAVRKFLMEYVESLPDYEQKWKDFYEGGAGVTLTDIAAGVTTFLSLNSYLNRKDSLLDYSSLPSTISSIASTLGYKINRPESPRLQLVFHSNKDIYWKKQNPIAMYKSKELVLLQDTWIKAGENTVVVVCGTWEKLELDIADNKDYLNIQVEETVDNNIYHVYLDDKEIATTERVEELDSESILIRTHLSGMFIIFGNGTHGRKPSIGEHLKIEYVKPYEKFLNTTIALDDVHPTSSDIGATKSDGAKDTNTLVAVKVLSPGSNQDTTDKLVATAPGFHSTRNMIRSAGDYKWVGSSYQGVISCQGRPHSNTCCARDIVYLREDELKFTSYQREEFEKFLKEHDMYGVEYFILDPKRILVDVKLKIVIDERADRASIEEAIRKLYENQTLKFASSFSPGSVFSMKSNEYMKAIYIQYPLKDRKAKFGEYFKLGSLNIEWVIASQLNTEDLSSGTDLEVGYVEDY